ncbi:peptidoglycan-binding protein [Ensifer sp. NBAIM29]|nr:peptidoglycan-binding protein [Ensifer sp. NBAIM29]
MGLPEISQVQQYLNQLSYPAGTADGRLGPKTREAIKAFQRDFNLPVTGRPDGALLSALRVAAAAAAKTETTAPAARNPERSGGFASLDGFDLPHGDYRSGIEDPGLTGISVGECEAQCASDDRCRAYTYNTVRRVCILKDSVPQPAPFAGATSGIKLATAPAPAASGTTAQQDTGGNSDTGGEDLTAWLRVHNPKALQVTASSSGWGANNSKVVDGSTEGDYHVWNHTLNGPDEWLQVDLGAEYTLTGVEVSNRNNKKFAARLNGAVVELRDAAGNVVVAFDPINGARDGSKHVYTAAKTARFVRIRHSNQHLHVTEVRVFGFPAEASSVARSASPDSGNADASGSASSPDPVTPGAVSVRTTAATYAPWEPIEVEFERAPGNRLDWVTIVQKTKDRQYKPPDTARRMLFRPPDGEVKPWAQLDGETTGSRILDGLGEGEYEVQLYARPKNPTVGEIVARYTFSVVSAPDHESAGILPEPKAVSLESGPSPSWPEPGQAGSWLAYNTCEMARGITRTITYHALLDISGETTATAELILNWMEGVAVRMSGTFEPKTQKLVLEASEWIRQPYRAVPPPRLVLTLDESGLRLSGELLNAEGCSAFEAYKFLRDSRPVNERGLVPVYAKYQRAAVNDTNCTRFANWLINGGSVEMQKVEVPLQVIDGEAFYKFAGKTFDDWTYEDAVLFEQFFSKCMSFLPTSRNVAALSLHDQAMRARTQVSNFLRVKRVTDQIGGGVYSSLFSFSTNYSVIVSMRIARQYAERTVAEAKSMSGTTENRRRIKQLMAHIDGQFGPYAGLPAEQAKRYVTALQEQDRRMVAEQARAALAQAEAELQRLQDTADASEKLSGLTALYQGRSAVEELLNPADRLALRSRVMEAQRAAAEEAIGNKMAALAALPVDEAAFAGIDAAEDELQPTLSLLIDRLAENYRAAIEKKRHETLVQLVKARVALLSTYSADRAGLEHSARWPAKFTETFSAFSETREYKDAMRQFGRSRNQLLLDALPKFEDESKAAYAQSGKAGVEAVLATYLSWEGDDGLPAYLEYQFVTDGFQDAPPPPPTSPGPEGLQETESKLKDLYQEHRTLEDRKQTTESDLDRLEAERVEADREVERLTKDAEQSRLRAERSRLIADALEDGEQGCKVLKSLCDQGDDEACEAVAFGC